MGKFILNGWGWGMPQPKKGSIEYEDLTKEQFQEEIKDATSCIGNPALARVLKLPYCPGYINLEEGDIAIVIRMNGGRLPAYARTVPEDIDLKFTKVEIKEAIV